MKIAFTPIVTNKRKADTPPRSPGSDRKRPAIDVSATIATNDEAVHPFPFNHPGKAFAELVQLGDCLPVDVATEVITVKGKAVSRFETKGKKVANYCWNCGTNIRYKPCNCETIDVGDVGAYYTPKRNFDLPQSTTEQLGGFNTPMGPMGSLPVRRLDDSHNQAALSFSGGTPIGSPEAANILGQLKRESPAGSTNTLHTVHLPGWSSSDGSARSDHTKSLDSTVADHATATSPRYHADYARCLRAYSQQLEDAGIIIQDEEVIPEIGDKDWPLWIDATNIEKAFHKRWMKNGRYSMIASLFEESTTDDESMTEEERSTAVLSATQGPEDCPFDDLLTENSVELGEEELEDYPFDDVVAIRIAQENAELQAIIEEHEAEVEEEHDSDSRLLWEVIHGDPDEATMNEFACRSYGI